jgi:hypothetical protein
MTALELLLTEIFGVSHAPHKLQSRDFIVVFFTNLESFDLR